MSFISSKYENWPECQLLYPHVTSAKKLKPKKRASVLQWAELLGIAADYACNRGALQESKSMAKHSLVVREEVLGPNNELTLKSMDILASAMGLAGRWEEGAELQEQAVKRRTETSAQRVLPMLMAKGNLAYFYGKLRRWEEAGKLQLENVEQIRALLGPDSLEALTATNNLTLLYEYQK